MNVFLHTNKQCVLDGINIKRQVNQLVVYTPIHGKKTGTNSLGVEVVVENNIVISKGTNNNFIPSNGFVLSGAGLAKDWINDCISLGSNIYLDEAMLIIVYS